MSALRSHPSFGAAGMAVLTVFPMSFQERHP